MADKYVATTGNNGNSGAIGSPWLTIAFGVSQLAAGDTLHIRAGTYNERIKETDFAVTGTSGAWITVGGYLSETVILTNPGFEEIIRFQDGSKQYIEFRDLTLDGSTFDGAGPEGYGITTAGYPNNSGDGTVSAHLRFRRIRVLDTWSNGMLIGGDSHEILGCYFEGCGRVPYATYNPGANGIYGVMDNSLIQGCEFFNGRGYGVRVGRSGYTTNGHATGNIVENCYVHQYGPGVGIGGGPSEPLSAGGGMVTWGNQNTFRNNIIYNVGGSGIDILAQAQDAALLNNTIVSATGYPVQVGLFDTATDSDIKNNIFWNNGSGDSINLVNESGTDATNNVTSNPLFVSLGTDFHLQAGSPAIDAGVALAAVTDDYDGNARPSGSFYDCGAFEYQQVVSVTGSPWHHYRQMAMA